MSGVDDVQFNCNGQANVVQVKFSNSTLKAAAEAGSAAAATGILTAACGNVSGPVAAVVGVIVAFGIGVIMNKVPNAQKGIQFKVNMTEVLARSNPAGMFATSMRDMFWHRYDPVYDFCAQ
eukprot:TRINITY_DN54_c0_g1_i1.p1 TRINITY_DN54_c0_g1~~TRINITY_DN54_c0_g1_i1.p1  ORF type:complete len:121 (-),score=27.15 TRINITY_DN54_c0_g1_i1:37-399(-)